MTTGVGAAHLMDGDTAVFTEASTVVITDTITHGDGEVMDMDGTIGAGEDTAIHMAGEVFIALITILLITITLIATILIIIPAIGMAIITTIEVMPIAPVGEVFITPIPL
ncbi:hypothetical protein DHD05_07490 [Arenibacter sp. N53]|nr:hypothetical protein [Arenibacter sp. N53]